MSASDSPVTGDRLTALQDLRDRLVAECAAADRKELPALGRLLRDVLADIEQLAPPEKKGSAFDEIARRRAAREAKTAG